MTTWVEPRHAVRATRTERMLLRGAAVLDAVARGRLARRERAVACGVHAAEQRHDSARTNARAGAALGILPR